MTAVATAEKTTGQRLGDVTAICGSMLAVRHNIPLLGFCLCFLLGPLGVIAVFFIDERRQCPHCLGRVPVGGPTVCCHCGRDLPFVRQKVTKFRSTLIPDAYPEGLPEGDKYEKATADDDSDPLSFLKESRDGLR